MKKPRIKQIPSPLLLPIFFFAGAILLGTILLHAPFSQEVADPEAGAISWINALFTATSATCVTGLAVVDTGHFSRAGQVVLLVLMQAGGLGIMSFSSLAFYLWRKRVTLTDRVAVGQSLLSDSSFHLGKFLVRLLAFTIVIEAVGALLLFLLNAKGFPPFSALFHAVSAFCNAGFSLHSDSLVSFRGNWPVSLIFMALIILGGLGFAVLAEGESHFFGVRDRRLHKRRLSWQTMIVLKSTFLLIVVGWGFIYAAEFVSFKRYLSGGEAILAALFQSVTCRTAGFNSLDIGAMTNVSLTFMMILMFIGGAPGSCAGGIKVTTFRVLWAFVAGQIKGRHQVVVGRYAVGGESINKALTLLFFSLGLILVSVLLLDFTEGGMVPHAQVRGRFLEICFEVVSAFGTVGLSMGLTPKLSCVGKFIIILLMFIGRLGPLMLLSALQSVQTRVLYARPEENLSIG